MAARPHGYRTSTIQRGLRELTADEVQARSISTRRCCAIWMRWSRTAPGDPDSATCQSARTLAVALDGLGHRVSHTVVSRVVARTGLQPAGQRQDCVRAASMSIGTRSFGTSPGACDARNGNSSRRFRWTPRRRSWSARSRTRAAPVLHDFVIPATATTGGKAYGIYDLHRNEGWVSVGIITTPRASRYDPALVAAHGSPGAQSLLITADAGGSNGARLRLLVQRCAPSTSGPVDRRRDVYAFRPVVPGDRRRPNSPYRPNVDSP